MMTIEEIETRIIRSERFIDELVTMNVHITEALKRSTDCIKDLTNCLKERNLL